MTEPKPIVPVDREGLEEVAESLLRGDPQVASTAPSSNIVTQIINPIEYITLPGKTHGSYSYPDLLVAMHRLGYDADVERAARTLGLSLQNTTKEQNGSRYIGNINWEQALKLNLLLGNSTLNPRQFIDFKELLKKGLKGTEVYDGKGAVIDSKILKMVHDEIFTVRDPFRGEWLDANFEVIDVIDNIFHINYDHKIANGVLKPQKSEPLENCLMEEKYVDLSSANRQGLPTRKSSIFSRKIKYYHPQNQSIAKFYAHSDRVVLDARGDPAYPCSPVGVRAAKIKR